MSLKSMMNKMLPAIEKELQQCIARLDKPATRPFYEMVSYHMGWSGKDAGPEATGKRIRPLLVLLACSACGAEWQHALPAAASIELLHSFSLAHDDIQDKSVLRRGRLAAWKKWGVAQAINVGDVLFILAHLIVAESTEYYPAETEVHIARIIDEACLALSSGQFLDIAYEKRVDLTVEDYWQMVSGKTAALISACTQVGALLGGSDESVREHYKSFGHYLGLAFQVQDDYLGIWGNSALTGKSNASDLVTGKKSLPVLLALSNNGQFARRWFQGPILAEEAGPLSEILAKEGIKKMTQDAASKMTNLAMQSLQATDPQGEAADALFELTNLLLHREA